MPWCARVCMCVCGWCVSVWQIHAVMSQALYCGCRPDSLIREECCPWHPVFHWNHTFIQPVSCPWVFLSAWTGEKREPSVSLSFSPLFLLCLSPPSPHAFPHPFHHFFSLLHHYGQLMQAIEVLYFLAFCCISLVWFWSDRRRWLKVSQAHLGSLLRKWLWIRVRGVFLGLVQDTCAHKHAFIKLSKKKEIYSWLKFQINRPLSLAVEQL